MGGGGESRVLAGPPPVHPGGPAVPADHTGESGPDHQVIDPWPRVL